MPKIPEIDDYWLDEYCVVWECHPANFARELQLRFDAGWAPMPGMVTVTTDAAPELHSFDFFGFAILRRALPWHAHVASEDEDEDIGT